MSRKLNLYELRLPAGDVGSINIGWGNNGAQIKLQPESWLPSGFDGIRIIGHKDGTSLRCTSWDGVTLAVRRHNGVVQVENVQGYAGVRAFAQFGEQNFDGDRRADGSLIQGTQRVTCPKFMLRVYESRLFVPPPAALGGVRGMWLLFGYQQDGHLRDVVLDAREAKQHIEYLHGNALKGTFWERVKALGAGSEIKKNRSDASETAWAGSEVWQVLKNCELREFGQPHGDYNEGGAIVMQNSASHGLVEDCVLRGRDQHAGCVMLSSEGNSYDIMTGKLNRGHGNGAWVVRRSGLYGSNVGGFWNNELVNVYTGKGTTAKAVQGFLMGESGCYGQNSQLSLSGVPAGTCFIEDSNTEAIKARARALGFDTTYQTVIPTSQRLVPVSEGYAR